MVEKTIPGFENILKSRKYKYDLCSTDIEHYKIKKYGESVFGGGSKRLKEIVSNLYDTKSERVCIIEGGCSMANFLVFYSLLEKGDEVLVEEPGYQPLYILPKIFGAKIKRFKRKYENNFQLNIKEILSKITKKTKLIVLTNFYNPGGVRINELDINLLLKEAKKKKFYVFCDETYADPLIKKDIKSVGLSEYGIATYGLSKKYGLSTLRCGIVVSSKEIINKIVKAQFTTTAVNSGVLEKEWLKFFKKNIYKLNRRSEKILNKNYDLLEKEILSRDNIEWVKPEKGSSVCVLKFNGIKKIKKFKEELEKRNILLAISDEGIVRLGVGSSPIRFKKSISELKKILDINL